MIRFATQCRAVGPYLRRTFITPPFESDLTEVDADDFNLADFQHIDPTKITEKKDTGDILSQIEVKKPLVVVSRLNDPYINLAWEDYIFTKMPLPNHKLHNYDRLMFYTNTPCVVIGKNQNPWKEANLPLLNSLHIPLVRRNSGGGTVVHDMGNVNFSYMTTKEAFDRHKFANIVAEAVNNHANPLVPLEVNKRGDIVTKSINGINYKVSGSAYKLAKGRSYHHGTMLLNLRLDILGQLLSRDESKLGKVDAMSSIPSVKAKVKNVEILSDAFRQVVINAFKSSSGEEPEIFEITKETELPSEVSELATQLTTREWVYGNTPKFTHELRSEKYGFTVRFEMDRKTVVSKVILQFDASVSEIDETAIRDSFQYLELMVKKGTLKYSGSEVAGFVTHDEISDWLGMAIDGTT